MEFPNSPAGCDDREKVEAAPPPLGIDPQVPTDSLRASQSQGDGSLSAVKTSKAKEHSSFSKPAELLPTSGNQPVEDRSVTARPCDPMKLRGSETLALLENTDKSDTHAKTIEQGKIEPPDGVALSGTTADRPWNR